MTKAPTLLERSRAFNGPTYQGAASAALK
jgi:hypothetical protein